MCVAIYKTATARLSKMDLALAHSENPDGCGFTVRTSKRLITKKGLWSFAEFWKHYQPYQAFEALVHFRFASMGSIHEENCHPFPLGSAAAFVHNGHLADYGSKEVSDTRHWAQEVLVPLVERYPSLWTDPLLQKLLGDTLGHSRVALLSLEHGPLILPWNSGVWEDGIWYSQTHYRHAQLTWSKPARSTMSLRDLVQYEPSAYPIDDCEVCGNTSARQYTLCADCAGETETFVWDER